MPPWLVSVICALVAEACRTRLASASKSDAKQFFLDSCRQRPPGRRLNLDGETEPVLQCIRLRLQCDEQGAPGQASADAAGRAARAFRPART